MGGEIREAFALSHTAYGSIYSLATLFSALALFRLGGLADAWPLSRVALFAVSCLSAGCLLLGTAPHIAVLGLGFMLIRFGGQGYISHLGITTAVRYFPGHEGKAVALAASGFPVAEALLPAGAVLVMGFSSWRWPWLAGVGVLMLLIMPVLHYLSRNTPAPVSDGNLTGKSGSGVNYTRKQVLQDPGFYMVLPAAVITPFVVTAILFHQAAIAELQGWTLQVVATAFSCYAAGHLGSLFFCGLVVDRLGAGRTLPLGLLPMSLGLLLPGFFNGSWVALVYLGLVGLTQGFAATAAGAVWAERYGVVHLGAVRSMAQAIMVVTTSVAPVLLGFFLDLGTKFSLLAAAMTTTILAAGILCAWAPGPVDKTRG
jgi:MFS family permease